MKKNLVGLVSVAVVAASLGILGCNKDSSNASGTFNYHCTIHASMTGTIIVQ